MTLHSTFTVVPKTVPVYKISQQCQCLKYKQHIFHKVLHQNWRILKNPSST